MDRGGGGGRGKGKGNDEDKSDDRTTHMIACIMLLPAHH